MPVTGDTGLPWLPRAHRWDESAARKRLRDYATGSDGALNPARYSRAFLYRHADADPTTAAAYSLPFADIADGRLSAVYGAVSHAAARLGQVAGLNPADRSAIAARLRTLYASAARAFDDPAITPPTSIQAREGEPVSTLKLPWRGPMAPYLTRSLDGWVINSMDTPKYTGLPLPLKFQQVTGPGHDGSTVGLAKIDKMWSFEGNLYGEGEFDAWDPAAILLAHKVKHGYVGQVSVDMGDCKILRRQFEGSTVNFVDDWTMMSATVCADPKFAAARIAVPADAPANADGEQHVLAASVTATFTFTGAMSAAVEFATDPDTLLTDPWLLVEGTPAPPGTPTVIDLAAKTKPKAPAVLLDDDADSDDADEVDPAARITAARNRIRIANARRRMAKAGA